MVEVKLYNPSELHRDDWRDLQALSRDAYGSMLNRTPDEVDVLVAWDDPAAYLASHLDPNMLDSQHSASDQEYSDPLVAIATEANQLVGYAYSVNSTPAGMARNRLVMRMAHKNYLWLRDMAVVPSLHRHGIARQMGKTLLREAVPMQPPVVHVLSDETRFLHGALERLGFEPTSERNVTIFGASSVPVRQVRMQAPTVRGVLQRM